MSTVYYSRMPNNPVFLAFVGNGLKKQIVPGYGRTSRNISTQLRPPPPPAPPPAPQNNYLRMSADPLAQPPTKICRHRRSQHAGVFPLVFRVVSYDNHSTVHGWHTSKYASTQAKRLRGSTPPLSQKPTFKTKKGTGTSTR